MHNVFSLLWGTRCAEPSVQKRDCAGATFGSILVNSLWPKPSTSSLLNPSSQRTVISRPAMINHTVHATQAHCSLAFDASWTGGWVGTLPSAILLFFLLEKVQKRVTKMITELWHPSYKKRHQELFSLEKKMPGDGNVIET